MATSRLRNGGLHSVTMKADKDAIVVDALGLARKVFAGQVVPTELVDAYKSAVGKTKTQEVPERNKIQDAPGKDKAQKAPEAKKSSRRVTK